MRSIEEIRAELRAAEQAESDAKVAAREAVPVIMRYTIERSAHGTVWDRVYSSTCTLYRLAGECTNLEEAQAVGHRPFVGAMNYLFNAATGRIVMAVGGGSTFLSQDAAGAAFEEVNAFLAANPTGGDITAIIESYRTVE